MVLIIWILFISGNRVPSNGCLLYVFCLSLSNLLNRDRVSSCHDLGPKFNSREPEMIVRETSCRSSKRRCRTIAPGSILCLLPTTS